MTRWLIPAVLSLAASVAQAAPHPSGPNPYRVVDGDTLQGADGVYVRIFGIDAPERDTRAGVEAEAAMATILAQGSPLKCLHQYFDRYGRSVAICLTQRADVPVVDIACLLVSQGHAVDWPRYSNGRYAGCAR